MTERWRTELDKLRPGELPDDLWGRIGEGPQLEPLGLAPRSRVAAAVAAFAVFAVAAVLEQDRELVPSEASGGVRLPERVLQTLADLAEHPVAGGVTERVVDRLEVVQVHEQIGAHHEDRLPGVGRLPRHLAVIDHFGPERGAVEDPGEQAEGDVET